MVGMCSCWLCSLFNLPWVEMCISHSVLYVNHVIGLLLHAPLLFSFSYEGPFFHVNLQRNPGVEKYI